MPAGWEGDAHVTVNTIGHLAGLVVFGIFLYLLFQQRSVAGLRFNSLPLAAAALASLWNFASLTALLVGRNSPGSLVQHVSVAIGFSALSLLPAVLLQLCLIGRFRPIAVAGYALSTVAVVTHLSEPFANEAGLHRMGLAVITVGFGALTALAIVLGLWSDNPIERTHTSRMFATMSLFLFAISFAHFGEGHISQAWSEELAFHHAGIPLALFVLMQEHRFVLLDAFVRFLANGLLAAVFGMIIVRLNFADSALQVCVAALLVASFAMCRETLQAFLARVVFRQPNRSRYEQLMRTLRNHYDDETAYLQHAAVQIAELMRAPLIELASDLPDSPALSDILFATHTRDVPELKELRRKGVRVLVPIRAAPGDTRYILLGERQGGRPYLSEDLAALARFAAAAAEHAERIRTAEAGRLVTQAELRALQAQIHPHFPFNAFNTLYGVIPREADAARRTVLNLADILRYFLRTERNYVALAEEMKIVEASLAIEAQRLGNRLQVSIEMDETLSREMIPVLTIQPIVENAIKHGVASQPEGGRVCIQIGRDHGGMRVSVSDTGPGFRKTTRTRVGVGLENVSRRLQLYYGPSAEVSIESTSAGSRVSFHVPFSERTPEPVAEELYVQ